MIGKCDFCEEDNRKIKYLYDNDIPVLSQCRYGCNNRRSIPSATNRVRPYEILDITKVQETYIDSNWKLKIKNEKDFIHTYYIKRRNGETKERLLEEIKSKCKNVKQIIHLNVDIYYD